MACKQDEHRSDRYRSKCRHRICVHTTRIEACQERLSWTKNHIDTVLLNEGASNARAARARKSRPSHALPYLGTMHCEYCISASRCPLSHIVPEGASTSTQLSQYIKPHARNATSLIGHLGAAHGAAARVSRSIGGRRLSLRTKQGTILLTPLGQRSTCLCSSRSQNQRTLLPPTIDSTQQPGLPLCLQVVLNPPFLPLIVRAAELWWLFWGRGRVNLWLDRLARGGLVGRVLGGWVDLLPVAAWHLVGDDLVGDGTRCIMLWWHFG